MKFDRHTAHGICAGKRTILIRPAPEPESVFYQRGNVRVVQSPTSNICRVRFSDVQRVPLKDVPDEALEQEGKSRDEFYAEWRSRYHTGPLDPEAHVWVIRLEVTEPHVPRLLHRDSSRGYTTNRYQALADEGEAVDEETQARFTDEARESFSAHLERERRERKRRGLEERLRAVQDVAARKGVDLTRKLASIERRIESAEREVGREDA